MHDRFGRTDASPRTELPLAIGPPGDSGCPGGSKFDSNSSALIGAGGRWKLVVGVTCPAHWAGPTSPNGTAEAPLSADCGSLGCLYDLEADPGEHNDLAAAEPGIASVLRKRLAALRTGVFQTPYDVDARPNCSSPAVQRIVADGVWAPWQT